MILAWKEQNYTSAMRYSTLRECVTCPRSGSELAGLHPESLVATATGKLQIFSDDGRLQIAGMACKDLPKKERRFRSVSIAR
jgi:hypothetical protein